MYKGKRIGFVVLNYNDAKTTISLCNKIKEYSLIDEIAVVDNCSTDNSYNLLLPLENEKIKVLKSEKNGGYSYGNNFGADYLINNKTDILYIANPDVDFEESFVEKTSDIIISDRAKACSSLVLNTEGKCTVYRTKINTYFEDLLECTLLLKKLMKREKPLSDNIGIVDSELLQGSLFAIDAKVYREINGLDENVFLYCEERILGKKLKDSGYAVAIDTSVSYIHMHAVSINKSVSKLNQIKRLFESRKYYYKQYQPLGTFKSLCLSLAFKYGVFVRSIICKINGKK